MSGQYTVEFYSPLTGRWHSASPQQFGRVAAGNLADRLRDRGNVGDQVRVRPIEISPEMEKAKGGKVTRTAGAKVGRDDGVIAAKKGEYVIKKRSAKKYGAAKMAAVNRGSAKVITKRKK